MTRTALLVFLAASSSHLRAEERPPICTDRPTKANAVCTVPAGAVQIETSAIGWTLTKAETRTELLTLGSSVAKFGVTDRSDIQIGIVPFVEISSGPAGSSSRIAGVSDLVVRYKQRITGDGARVQSAVIPFVKLPTAAADLGNGKVEAGLAVPISFALIGPVTLTLGPEIDLLANASGDGYHLAVVNLVNLAVPIAPRWTLIGEVWSNFNFDPAGTIEQVSFDAAVSHLVSEDLQLDLGGNAGLTADTPDLELYAGLSVRF